MRSTFPKFFADSFSIALNLRAGQAQPFDIKRFIQGGPPKLSQFGFLQFSINAEATLMCNKSYERKFCWLLGDIFKNCEKLSYGAEFAFFWQVAELANNPITRYW